MDLAPELLDGCHLQQAPCLTGLGKRQSPSGPCLPQQSWSPDPSHICIQVLINFQCLVLWQIIAWMKGNSGPSAVKTNRAKTEPSLYHKGNTELKHDTARETEGWAVRASFLGGWLLSVDFTW